MATFLGSVAASGDDGLWIPAVSNFGNTETQIATGNSAAAGNNPVHSFVRVDNVTVSGDATITDAYINWIAFITLSGTTCDLTISGVDEDDADCADIQRRS